jgi:hypothetical protein
MRLLLVRIDRWRSLAQRAGRLTTGGLATLVWLLAALPAAAAPTAALEPVDHAVCRLVERAAGANGLPVGYLTRIIWRESSFRAAVVSPAGAEGIAQFMPGTAHERGLADPFDPEEAIPKAARLLADLRQQFGSLAYAAAAYNAGAARVVAWLRGAGDLPAVTHAYVSFVTAGDGDERCLALAAELRRGRGLWGTEPGEPPAAPWGVQLAGNFSKAAALAAFERKRQKIAALVPDVQPMVIGRLLRSRGTRPYYQVRLPAASRQIAEMLCGRIQAAGGTCVAMPS